tara:strand:+ start:1438 stop:2229 length:792 start_codon:yes stop_codon:yes gene_type:complete
MSDVIIHKPVPDIKWPHRIVDNFFSEKELNWIRKSFNKGYRDLEKRFPKCFENGKMKPYDEIKHMVEDKDVLLTGFSAYVPFWSTERVSEAIDDVWKEAIEIYPYKKDKNIKRKDFFSYLELNIYPVGLTYNRHLDVNYKSFTGVVYIGKEGDGTTLICGEREIDVHWQDNRSVLFMNVDEERRDKRDYDDKLSSWHRYANKGNDVRFAINFNMTHMDDVGSLIGNFLHRDKKIFSPFEKEQREVPKFGPILVSWAPVSKEML